MAKALWKSLLEDDPHRFHLILGPRRVGKTTVLYQTVRHLISEGVSPDRIWWMRLDHPVLMREDLSRLVRQAMNAAGATPDRPVYLMLDELVYIEDWDLWLKTFFDDQWPVRIAATSSATADLRKRRTESGIGRWTEQYLGPYHFAEFLNLAGVEPPQIDVGSDLAETIAHLRPGQPTTEALMAQRRAFMLVGGFPELLAALVRDAPESEGDQLLRSQRVLRTDAVERAIYKDIPQSFGVDNPMTLERLLYVLAAQVTGILSPTNVSNDLGIAQPTLDKYVSYLEQAYMIFTLSNFSGIESNVQRRGRKLYFVDGAIRNAALQRGLTPLDNPTELGHLLENLVATAVRNLAILTNTRVFHWRDKREEVDLILNLPGAPMAFEIGSSVSHSRSGLGRLIERFPEFSGRSFLVTPPSQVQPPDESGIGSLPLDLFLIALGLQSELALSANLGGYGAAS